MDTKKVIFWGVWLGLLLILVDMHFIPGGMY